MSRLIEARDEGWRVSDALWERIEPLLPARSGLRFSLIRDSTPDRDRLALDGQILKAPYGSQATGPKPTDRAKPGRRRSVLTDAGAVPFALVTGGANGNDQKLLEGTLDAANRAPGAGARLALCLDKGYHHASPATSQPATGSSPRSRAHGEEAAPSLPGTSTRTTLGRRTHVRVVQPVPPAARQLETAHPHPPRAPPARRRPVQITWRRHRTHPVTRAEATC